MPEQDLFQGLTQEDIGLFLEALGILGLAIGIIIVFIIPIFHIASRIGRDPFNYFEGTVSGDETPAEIARQIFKHMLEEYLFSLRKTLPWTATIGGGGLALFILFPLGMDYLQSTGYCKKNALGCEVWINSGFSAAYMSIGLFCLVMLVHHARHGRLAFIYLFFAITIGIYTKRDGWQTLFGGNCEQDFAVSSSEVKPETLNSEQPFAPGKVITIHKTGLTIEPWESGYCVSVTAPVGAQGTIVYVQPDKMPPAYVHVRWDEQPFQEMSFLGFMKDRKATLKPFTSLVWTDFLDPPQPKVKKLVGSITDHPVGSKPGSANSKLLNSNAGAT